MVFPTLVGVFPYRTFTRSQAHRLPHARGGVSVWIQPLYYLQCVFPTLVGVFLYVFIDMFSSSGLPHARGGVSKNNQRDRKP